MELAVCHSGDCVTTTPGGLGGKTSRSGNSAGLRRCVVLFYHGPLTLARRGHTRCGVTPFMLCCSIAYTYILDK